jgi:hypothetical protein
MTIELVDAQRIITIEDEDGASVIEITPPAAAIANIEIGTPGPQGADGGTVDSEYITANGVQCLVYSIPISQVGPGTIEVRAAVEGFKIKAVYNDLNAFNGDAILTWQDDAANNLTGRYKFLDGAGSMPGEALRGPIVTRVGKPLLLKVECEAGVEIGGACSVSLIAQEE